MRRVLLSCAALLVSGCLIDLDDLQGPGYLLVSGMPSGGGDADPRALTMFDADLAGYGVWTEDSRYGTVWTPYEQTFVPYATNGSFVRLDGQLVWVSDLPWGRATLHHGRWVRHEGSWSWVPGTTYSRAWVSWYDDGQRTSWAPTPPGFAWRRGVAYRIAPPAEPIVGTKANTELALVPRADEDDE